MTVEEEIAAYEAKNGELPAHNRATLRSMIERENKWWDREANDHLNGYDDGEPQTTVDFNYFNKE
jgi:hypothetical protein